MTDRRLGSDLLWFEDHSELLDAAMMFGAHAELGAVASPQATARIVVARGRERWPALYWFVSLMHLHGIEMTIVSGPAAADRINFATRFEWRFVSIARTWYDRGRARTPHNLVFTDRMIACALVDAMASAAPGNPIVVAPPRMALWPARRLRHAIRVRGPRGVWPDLRRASAGYHLIIRPDRREAVAQWLDRWVPRSIFEREASAV